MKLAYSLRSKYEIVGTKRTLPKEELPFTVCKLDFRDEATYGNLNHVVKVDQLVVNIPPNARAESAQENYRNMLDLILTHAEVKKLIFVSSTGVFGKNEGVVDEFSKPIPDTMAGKILLEAEERILSQTSFIPIVLRPSGLMGGVRHPVKYLAGRTNIAGRFHPVNLVHREDLVFMTNSLLKKSSFSGRIFHACAAQHPSKKQFYAQEAIKMGLKPPNFDEEDNSLGKEVSARWSKENLNLSFTYEDPYSMF